MTIRKYKGLTPTFPASTYIDEQACVIGNVTLGEDCSVWPMVVMRGDMDSIKVGNRTNIQDATIVHVTHGSKYFPTGYDVVIGDDVTIGHKATIHGCHIGNRVLVGIDTTILDGAIIEDDVMIGAGSLIPPGKRITSKKLWLGRPARAIRDLTKKEIAFLKYSAKSYSALKNTYIE